MITSSQTIDRDTLNGAFVSKSATGMQIMAGSLRLLGNVQVDGATTLAGLTLNGTLSAGANNITTTGTITGGVFSGNGASLTSLNGSNISSGTVADTRLSNNVFLLNTAQTVTANTTLSAAANLYFAGGTTYKIDTSGNGYFNGLNIAGVATFDGNDYVTFGSAGIAPPSSANTTGTKIQLYSSNYQIGIESSSIWYDADTYHRFYTNSGNGTRVERARVDTTGLVVTGTATITGALDIQGELKATGYNEFPDPLVASGAVGKWGTSKDANLTVAYDIQAPVGTGALGSIKLTSINSDSDAWGYYDYYFDINPNDWVTFSCYAFATTTGVSGQMYFEWTDANKTNATYASNTFTYATAWTRQFLTAQAPSTARYFRVRMDVDAAGGIAYASAFQVERGRTMTGFKPYAGGKDGSIYAVNNLSTWKSGNASISLDGAGLNKTLWMGGTGATVQIEGNAIVNTATFTGLATFNGSIKGNQSGAVRIDTGTGYVDVGSKNANWSHFYTDKPRYYFDHRIIVDEGIISSFDDDLVFQVGDTGSGGTTALTIRKSDASIQTSKDFYLNNNLHWAPSVNMLLEATANGQEFSIDLRNTTTYTGTYWQVWSDKNSRTILSVTGDTERVGILNASPQRRLHVTGDARIETTLEVGTGTAASDFNVTSGGSFNYRNMIWSDGSKVAIGKTSGTEILEVSGNISATNMHAGFIKFFSTFADLTNGSTWYGVGLTNLSDSSGPSRYLTQLAGYWGVNLKTSANELRIPMSGAVTLNSNRILTTADTGHRTATDITNGLYQLTADLLDGKHSSDLLSSTVYREKFTVPAGGYVASVAITIPNARSYILGSNRLQVFRDGWLMEPTDDYTEDTTTTVKFVYALPAGTKITFVIHNAG